MALNFEQTVDNLKENTAYSLDSQEKQALNSVGRAALRGNEKGWVDYFKNKKVMIGGNKVSVDTIARGLEIKQNLKNPNRPIVTYKGTQIGRGSEVAALLQVHAMTTCMRGLKDFGIDGKIGKETATALRGSNYANESYKGRRSGVDKEREVQELSKNKSINEKVKRGIDSFNEDLIADSIGKWWVKEKKINFSAVCYNNGRVKVYDKNGGQIGGKNGGGFMFTNTEFLDEKGMFSSGKFAYKIMKECYGKAVDDFCEDTKKLINSKAKVYEYTQTFRELLVKKEKQVKDALEDKFNYSTSRTIGELRELLSYINSYENKDPNIHLAK